MAIGIETAGLAALAGPRISGFGGLRLTADEYFELPNDGNKYELVDGVMLMSPSQTPRHQNVAAAIFRPLSNFVVERNLGLVLFETDIRLGRGRLGRDVVYRPEIIFIPQPRVQDIRGRIEFAPDVVVEIVSPDSRSLDRETKYQDYERAGVREYWLIDPVDERMDFFRFSDGRFVPAASSADTYPSEAVTGFQLDLAAVRATFRQL